jgi:hypothetical protein
MKKDQWMMDYSIYIKKDEKRRKIQKGKLTKENSELSSD